MSRFLSISIHCIVGALAVVSPCNHALAGEPRDEIVLGTSTALTGPAADLGINMRAGILAAIDECNRAGGIHGRTLRLISLDDAYEPSKTAPNMRKLIEEEKVLAVVGNVGTPTAIAAVPIAVATKTPFYGAFTGAGMLRKTSPDRYVINYRASYVFLDGSTLTVSQIDSIKALVLKKYAAGANFEQLSDQFTMDGNTTHGDTGWFFGEEMMPKEFQEAVKGHKIGDIFSVDVSEKQWHYIVKKTYEDDDKKDITVLRANGR